MFKKVLVANRGEIAVRIIKACQELGIATVAVASEADREALHTQFAAQTVYLGEANASQSYLRPEKIIAAALETNCDAIHPGYGFLSENADFAEQVEAAGLTFIGPDAAAIRAMGNKTQARQLMAQAGVPVIPGYDGQDSAETLAAAAAQIGYPVLVKAAAGGGGKGMRLVESPDELPYALEAARREAQNAFGNDQLYLEKYLVAPRHIEFQILADQHGQMVHLFERECSIQRRHQKIIEETPSPFLDDDLRTRMAQAALAAAAAVNYVNAGTIEFLVDTERNFYFLEMNTRLQVEHPITEAVTGIDLVQAQLQIASEQPLTLTQADLQQRGHAIECRIYAEDQAQGFLPASGPILYYNEPQGPGIRVDSGFQQNDLVTIHYDPLLAKLIVHATDRGQAIRKMAWALQQYLILGLSTNLLFLQDVMASPEFAAGETPIDFVETVFGHWPETPPEVPDLALVAAALFELQTLTRVPAPSGDDDGDPYNPWQVTDRFRIGAHNGF